MLAIDPGPEKSAYVLYYRETGNIAAAGILPNTAMLQVVSTTNHALMAIEMIASYGMPVGKEIFETCVWIGRFIEAASCDEWRYIYRKDVKLHLCSTTRATDGNIRQALIDLFGPGSPKAIGTKKEPGPLHKIKGDMWAALAVAITAAAQ